MVGAGSESEIEQECEDDAGEEIVAGGRLRTVLDGQVGVGLEQGRFDVVEGAKEGHKRRAVRVAW